MDEIWIRGIERIVIVLCSPLLIFLGWKLFASEYQSKELLGSRIQPQPNLESDSKAGVHEPITDINLSSEALGFSARLKTASPGAFTFFLGVTLAVIALAHPYSKSEKKVTGDRGQESEVNVRYLGSESSPNLLLSTRIKFAIANSQICTRTVGESDKCSRLFSDVFSSIPTQNSIDRIIALESAVRKGDEKAKEKLDEIRRSIEK